MKLHEEKSLFDIILAYSIMYSTATAAYIYKFDVGFALNPLALTTRRFYCVYVCVEDDAECMYYLVCIHFIKVQKKSNCSHTSWCGLNIFTQAFFAFLKQNDVVQLNLLLKNEIDFSHFWTIFIKLLYFAF